MRTQALLLVVLLLLPLAGALERSASGSEDLYIVFAPLSDRRGIESLERTVEQLGGEVLEEFSLLRAALVKGSRELASSLGRLGYQVSRNLALHLTTPLQAEQPSLRHGVPNVGAPSAWALGLNGSGVKVAVIDTGIENNHPWLMRGGKSVVAWEVDATGKGELDYCGKRTALASAHGTHVAGIIASQDSENRGVAPGVMLYDIIAFSRDYQCIYTDEATLMRALEYALKGPDGRPGTGDEADVINLSLGTVLPLEPLYSVMRGRGTKPAMIEALERAAAMNKVLVVAVGNVYGINLFNTLCLASGVICVGAADDARNADPRDDRLAPFSSRGPGFPATFVPHLVAPGVSIESSVPTETGAFSFPFSGTSMATPFVTGAAAILVQQAKKEGAVSPREILRALVQTARDVKGYNVTWWGQGVLPAITRSHSCQTKEQAPPEHICGIEEGSSYRPVGARPHLLVPRFDKLVVSEQPSRQSPGA
ncbi:MAG: S8 family serine peptidase [Acidilobaceae archaeon]